MKTLQYLKDEYAQETGFYNNFQELLDDDGADLDYDFDEIARRYAHECCKATLEKASQSINHSFVTGADVEIVITNEDNIILL